MLQIKDGVRVEDPREYGAAAVVELRQLLEDGMSAQKDPRRKNFYELEGQNETFYVYVSPMSGSVVLLAKWNRQTQEFCMTAGEMVA